MNRFLAAALILAGSLAAQQLSPQEERGRKIFNGGKGSSAVAITAQIFAGAADVPATQVPCSSCHGADGRGRPEGGVEPSNIQWNALAGAPEIIHAGGRRHAAYTDRTITRAVTMGIDPGGNRLQTSMPRYRITREDLADLIAYLKRVGDLPDPGITLDSIDIGIILPPAATRTQVPNESPVDLRTAIKAALTGYFDQVNKKGGVFSRRVIPRFLDPPVLQQGRILSADFFGGSEPFALVSSFAAGAEAPLASFLENRQIPLVGALALNPPQSPGPYVFYLDSGVSGECDALIDYVEKQFPVGPHRSAVIHSTEEISEALSSRVHDRLWGFGWPAPLDLAVPGAAGMEALGKTLTESGVVAVFYLASGGSPASLIAASQASGGSPEFLFPGSLASSELWDAPRLDGKVLLAYSSLLTDGSPEGASGYRKLAETYHLSTSHLAMQWKAIAGAELLVNALSTVGRDLSRQKLITALEGVYKFESGLIPPLSYEPNRRFGITTDHVVLLDPTTRRILSETDELKVKK